MKTTCLGRTLVMVLAGALCGCTQLPFGPKPDDGLFPPVLNPITPINKTLRELPPPERRVAVAVYGYTDQTGQFKPSETVQSLSRAVTQGATSVLIKALQDSGDGSWFTVVEREKLDNLLKERRIITDMRMRYLGEKRVNAQALPPLLFAGILLEGGIIGFDSNTRTGGVGARYLGIGGDVKYKEDTVTIYLRAISTKTGEVLVSTVSHKTVVSYGIQGGAFRFVSLDEILEAEAGITRNEPEQLAVQQAIEKAVYALIVDGAARGLWAFQNRAFQARAIYKFDEEQATYRKHVAAETKQTTAVAAAKPKLVEPKAAPADVATKAAPEPQPQAPPQEPREAPTSERPVAQAAVLPRGDAQAIAKLEAEEKRAAAKATKVKSEAKPAPPFKTAVNEAPAEIPAAAANDNAPPEGWTHLDISGAPPGGWQRSGIGVGAQ